MNNGSLWWCSIMQTITSRHATPFCVCYQTLFSAVNWHNGSSMFFSSAGHTILKLYLRERSIFPYRDDLETLKMVEKRHDKYFFYLTLPQSRRTTIIGLIMCHLLFKGLNSCLNSQKPVFTCLYAGLSSPQEDKTHTGKWKTLSIGSCAKQGLLGEKKFQSIYHEDFAQARWGMKC